MKLESLQETTRPGPQPQPPAVERPGRMCGGLHPLYSRSSARRARRGSGGNRPVRGGSPGPAGYG